MKIKNEVQLRCPHCRSKDFFVNRSEVQLSKDGRWYEVTGFECATCGGGSPNWEPIEGTDSD